jgi:hypothetical protein
MVFDGLNLMVVGVNGGAGLQVYILRWLKNSTQSIEKKKKRKRNWITRVILSFNCNIYIYPTPFVIICPSNTW